MTTLAVLKQEEVQARLGEIAGWELSGNAICRQFRFKDFVESMTFVLKVAFLAEQADHHPDITISYNKVSLVLTTHNAGGITEKDLSLARQINEIPSPVPAT